MVPHDEQPDDEETHGGLTLRVYADLMARLRAGEDPNGLLQQRALTDDQWRTARREWTRAIDAELERGEDRLVVAFAAELEAARRALAVPEAAPPSAAPRVEVPTFLREQPAPRPTFLAEPTPAVDDHPEERTALAPLPSVATMPFAAAPAPSVTDAQPASLRAPPSSRGFGPPPAPFPAPSPLAGETQALRVPRTAAAPSLTLEQYASLVVELDLAPQLRGAVLARYRLPDEDAFVALEMAYRRRFGAEAGLLSRFAELVKQYRQWKTGR